MLDFCPLHLRIDHETVPRTLTSMYDGLTGRGIAWAAGRAAALQDWSLHTGHPQLGAVCGRLPSLTPELSDSSDMLACTSRHALSGRVHVRLQVTNSRQNSGCRCEAAAALQQALVPYAMRGRRLQDCSCLQCRPTQALASCQRSRRTGCSCWRFWSRPQRSVLTTRRRLPSSSAPAAMTPQLECRHTRRCLVIPLHAMVMARRACHQVTTVSECVALNMLAFCLVMARALCAQGLVRR